MGGVTAWLHPFDPLCCFSVSGPMVCIQIIQTAHGLIVYGFV